MRNNIEQPGHHRDLECSMSHQRGRRAPSPLHSGIPLGLQAEGAPRAIAQTLEGGTNSILRFIIVLIISIRSGTTTTITTTTKTAVAATAAKIFPPLAGGDFSDGRRLDSSLLAASCHPPASGTILAAAIELEPSKLRQQQQQASKPASVSLSPRFGLPHHSDVLSGGQP